MKSVPAPVKRQLRAIGKNIRTQRKLLGLTAAMVAERAGVSAQTLSHLENGRGAGLDTVLAVMRVLGLADALVAASDPYGTDVGRMRATETLPQRVRVSTDG